MFASLQLRRGISGALRRVTFNSTFGIMSTPQAAPAPLLNGGADTRKRAYQGGPAPKRQKINKQKPVKEGSSEEVLIADVRALFAAQQIRGVCSNRSQSFPVTDLL